MKKKFILAPLAVMLVLGFCSAKPAMNPQLLMNQEDSTYEVTEEKCPSPLLEGTQGCLIGKQGADCGGSCPGEQAPDPGEIAGDQGDLTEPSSDDQVDNLSGEDPAQADVPVPDGRVFLCGEPPYGYLPTFDPKENVTVQPELVD